MGLKKKSNLKNIVKRLSTETKREKRWKKKVRKATNLRRYGKISRKAVRRMLKGTSNKKYHIKVEDVEVKAGKAIEDKVEKAEDDVTKVKDMVEPEIIKQDENSDIYEAKNKDYLAVSENESANLDIYSENRNEGSMRRGMKQIMESYMIKLYVLTKGPFRKVDATYNRMKDVLLKKYN